MKNNRYKIELENSAKEELEKIYYYIEKILREPIIAKKLIIKISENISILKYYPKAFPVLEELIQVRKLVVKKYIILYSINEKLGKVCILHIYNKSQKY